MERHPLPHKVCQFIVQRTSATRDQIYVGDKTKRNQEKIKIIWQVLFVTIPNFWGKKYTFI